MIVTASEDNTARIWDVASRRSIRVLEHPTVFTVLPSVRTAGVWLLRTKTARRVWVVRSGRVVSTSRGHDGAVLDAEFSPDGKLIVTAGVDQTARIWDATSGRTLAVLRGHGGDVFDAAFSPDGRLVATASSDWTARMWDPEERKECGRAGRARHRRHRRRLRPGQRSARHGEEDGTALLWDTRTEQNTEDFIGHTGWVSAAFSPDGEHIVTAGEDATASIWALGNPQPILSCAGTCARSRARPSVLAGAGRHLEFRRDGAHLAGGADLRPASRARGCRHRRLVQS